MFETNEVIALETFRNSFKISLIIVVLWPQVVAAEPDPSLSFGKYCSIFYYTDVNIFI